MTRPRKPLSVVQNAGVLPPSLVLHQPLFQTLKLPVSGIISLVLPCLQLQLFSPELCLSILLWVYAANPLLPTSSWIPRSLFRLSATIPCLQLLLPLVPLSECEHPSLLSLSLAKFPSLLLFHILSHIPSLCAPHRPLSRNPAASRLWATSQNPSKQSALLVAVSRHCLAKVVILIPEIAAQNQPRSKRLWRNLTSTGLLWSQPGSGLLILPAQRLRSPTCSSPAALPNSF